MAHYVIRLFLISISISYFYFLFYFNSYFYFLFYFISYFYFLFYFISYFYVLIKGYLKTEPGSQEPICPFLSTVSMPLSFIVLKKKSVMWYTRVVP